MMTHEQDSQYQALRLRGLAGLLRASGGHLQELTNLHEVMFFLASSLDEIAEALSALRKETVVDG
jgi:hypothetical protein